MKLLRRHALLFVCLLFTAHAEASAFSALVVYGDSLSDNGNLLAATGIPGVPYYGGRRSDGPVAVETLASRLGVPLFDFAWIGATTGIGNYADGGSPTSFGAFNLPGLATEYAMTQAFAASMPDALFVVWAGPNDLLAPAAEDMGNPALIVQRAVTNELAVVSALLANGAQHILVPGMPDVGVTPYFQSLSPAAAAGGTLIAHAFNAALAAALPAGVTFFDTDAVVQELIANPAAFGLTNVTGACFDGAVVCANPSEYLFFDEFHPSAAAHAIVGARMFSAVTPSPAMWSVALLMLLGCMHRTRRAYTRVTATR